MQWWSQLSAHMEKLDQKSQVWLLQLTEEAGQLSILTWHGDHRDQEGGVSTARPIHCTPSGLTRTTTPNRGGSSAQFLLVGTSVRAVPLLKSK